MSDIKYADFRFAAVAIAACLLCSALPGALPSFAKAPAEPQRSTHAHYRRADMLISGSSCATCLMRIERKLQAAPGVKKAAVSIYKPYPAVIIYDTKRTNLAEILASLKGEPVVTKDVQETVIDKLPVVIAPKMPDEIKPEQKQAAP